MHRRNNLISEMNAYKEGALIFESFIHFHFLIFINTHGTKKPLIVLSPCFNFRIVAADLKLAMFIFLKKILNKP